MKQYPHFLFVRQVGEAVQDDEGNWSTPAENWMMHSICREETNGKGTVINGSDGKAIVFSSAVYMPRTATRISEGVEVRIMDANDSDSSCRIKGVLLKFEVGQLNCRLWV